MPSGLCWRPWSGVGIVVLAQDGAQNSDLHPRVKGEGGHRGEGYPTCGRTSAFSHSPIKQKVLGFHCTRWW